MAQSLPLAVNILKTVFHHVANGDQPGKAIVFNNRHMAEAACGHIFHQTGDAGVLGRGDHLFGHMAGYGVLQRGSAACRNRFDNVAL